MSACTHQLMLVQSELVQFSNELAVYLIRTAVIFLFSIFLSHIQTFLFAPELCLSL